MLFNSTSYLIFFPLAVLVYFIVPKKLKNLWLLAVSYYFYIQWNTKYAILLAGSTFVTYLGGIFLEALRNKGKKGSAKACLAGVIVVNLAILFFFKYSNFFIENLNRVNAVLGQDKQYSGIDILLPVGISFYIFQALGYTIDVYRGEMKAAKNILKYALFVSFFPQLIAGPIGRSKQLLHQFDEEHSFDADRVRSGLLMMAWGLFSKMVIADNISPTVDLVFNNFNNFSGVEMIIATVLFGIQIYCDFAGYSLLAIGSAKVLGFKLIDNFKSPYFAMSISEFWKRWHISLTSWFRDYIYIPLGGNRKGKARKYMNVMIIFLVSGFWHGAQWTYIIWGGLNGLFMVVEGMTASFRAKVRDKFSVDTTRFSYRFATRLITFCLVDFTWLFFRAPSFTQAIKMIEKTFAFPAFERTFGLAFVSMGMSSQVIAVVIISVIFLFVVDGMQYKGIDMKAFVFSQAAWFRYMIYAALLLSILVFGVYGNLYEQSQFIYFQF